MMTVCVVDEERTCPRRNMMGIEDIMVEPNNEKWAGDEGTLAMRRTVDNEITSSLIMLPKAVPSAFLVTILVLVNRNAVSNRPSRKEGRAWQNCV